MTVEQEANKLLEKLTRQLELAKKDGYINKQQMAALVSSLKELMARKLFPWVKAYCDQLLGTYHPKSKMSKSRWNQAAFDRLVSDMQSAGNWHPNGESSGKGEHSHGGNASSGSSSSSSDSESEHALARMTPRTAKRYSDIAHRFDVGY
ncbi:hypothetical protein ACM66B_003351 [Microbotryomycetes sp. NB124-2]